MAKPKKTAASTRVCWWNYRVTVRRIHGEKVHAIQEVHHRCASAHRDGKCPTPEIHMIGWSESDSAPHGETPGELLRDLHMMLLATRRPVLDIDAEHLRIQRARLKATRSSKKSRKKARK